MNDVSTPVAMLNSQESVGSGAEVDRWKRNKHREIHLKSVNSHNPVVNVDWVPVLWDCYEVLRVIRSRSRRLGGFQTGLRMISESPSGRIPGVGGKSAEH